MKAKALALITLLALLALTLSGPATASVGATLAVAPQPAETDSPQARIAEALRSSPVMFIQNVGQFDERALFQVRGGDKIIWLTEDGIWVTVPEKPPRPKEPLQARRFDQEAGAEEPPRKAVNIKLSFPGANPHPRLEPFHRLDTVVSYFIGNDPAKWRVAVPVWGGVRYVGLYPGVDLELRGENGQVVPRLVAHPGADLSAVRLRVEGAEEVALGGGGGLLLRTALGEFTLPLFRVEGGSAEPARARRVDGQAFEVFHPLTAGNEALGASSPMVHSQQAVSLLYAGFLGGSDWDDGWGIAVDASGNAYVTGRTESGDFPTTPGAFDTTYGGGTCGIGPYTYPCPDAFVAKVNPSGTALVYAGFLGGSGSDVGRGIAVDASGNAYVTGYTYSSDFPAVVGPDLSHNGNGDAFVAKVNPSGTALVYAGFLGGSGEDEGEGIAVDASGNAYVTGYTTSSDFPAVVGPDLSYNGGVDAFVAKGGAGGGPEPFSGAVVPIWPITHTMASRVMQGGVAHRHFRLLDAGGNPIPNATVAFSVGDPAATDAQGYFTYTVPADALGYPGSYSIRIRSVTIGGQTYTTNDQPTFGVEVQERRYSHAWSYGASTRAKGGVLTGLVAYLQRTTSGGLELKLDESNPDAASDDVVWMKEDFSDEIGAGGGVGIEAGVSILILQVRGGASATAELALRGSGSTKARFPQPYADNDRKAEGVFLLASVIDSLGQAFPGKPFALQFLKLALDRGAPYRGYISEQQAALGSKIKPIQANVGAGASLGLKRGEATWKERLLGFDLVDVGVTVVHLNLLTDYRDRNEWGLGFESEHDVDWSLLSWNIGDFKNKFAGAIGDRAKKVKLELIFDSSTDALKRLELSFTGEGNPYAFTDVLKEEVTVKLIIPADQLGSDRLARTVNILRLLWAAQQVRSDPLRIGPSAMVNELNNLLDGLGYAEYEVKVEDGAETRLETKLGVTFGIDIELGPGLEVKKTRDLARERGVFLNGKPYVTETYNADAYVSRPGKSWWDLTTNALGGLWLLVRDAFTWVGRQVTSGVGWVIGTVSRTVEGAVRGGAQLIAPPGTQLYARSFGAQGVAIQQTGPITVTAIGWVPEAVAGAGALSLRPALAAASGEGFVVGGIYEFQPYTLTLSPGATLVITYTDEAAAGVDESRIGMFRWNPEGNNWQPMAAISDTAHNVFTATITQLGTFALGYDATPPQITILEPMNGSIITNTLPLIRALVADAGVGIDPATVEMRLDGQVVAAAFITGTGELAYLPAAPLAAGPHTVSVKAWDVLGNPASASAAFTVRSEWRIYLPLVLRSSR